MKRLSLAALASLMLLAQSTRPSCNHCSASYVAAGEIDAYLTRAPAQAVPTGVSDQQVRAVDVGKSNVDIGVVYRGKLTGQSPVGATLPPNWRPEARRSARWCAIRMRLAYRYRLRSCGEISGFLKPWIDRWRMWTQCFWCGLPHPSSSVPLWSGSRRRHSGSSSFPPHSKQHTPFSNNRIRCATWPSTSSG
jgi:hypothetical protein